MPKESPGGSSATGSGTAGQLHGRLACIDSTPFTCLVAIDKDQPVLVGAIVVTLRFRIHAQPLTGFRPVAAVSTHCLPHADRHHGRVRGVPWSGKRPLGDLGELLEDRIANARQNTPAIHRVRIGEIQPRSNARPRTIRGQSTWRAEVSLGRHFTAPEIGCGWVEVEPRPGEEGDIPKIERTTSSGISTR